MFESVKTAVFLWPNLKKVALGLICIWWRKGNCIPKELYHGATEQQSLNLNMIPSSEGWLGWGYWGVETLTSATKFNRSFTKESSWESQRHDLIWEIIPEKLSKQHLLWKMWYASFFFPSHGTVVSWLYPSSKSFAEPLQSMPLGLLWSRVHGSLWTPCCSTTFCGGWRHSNGWIYCGVITENLPVFPPLYYLSVDWNLIQKKGNKDKNYLNACEGHRIERSSHSKGAGPHWTLKQGTWASLSACQCF